MDQVTSPMDPVAPASLLPTLGKRCMACGAPLARDQRYCLECGERCGDPRVPHMTGRPPAAPAPAAAPRRRRRPSASTSTTLIAGVGTLLLALGVGVEIGRSSGKTAGAPPVRVVTVNGGGATTASATVTATPSATTSASAGKKKADAKKEPDPKQQTVSPVITPSAKATPPPVVKIGSKGHGAGYHNGKFDGNFFGG